MHILVVRNNSNPKAIDASIMLSTYFASQNVDCTLVDATNLGPNGSGVATIKKALSAGIDMAVILGGDGTILRTARCIGESGVPLLGLNFGRLGFLANNSDEGVIASVASALSGDVAAEKRTNLRIDVICEGEKDPWDMSESSDWGYDDAEESTAPHTFFALNEVAVTRGALGRIIDFSLGISGSSIADMRGDGLVVATATGSTGYALSIGGPLVAPTFNGLVVVPIAPHTLHSRAILTSESDVVEMDLSNNPDDRAATLFIDGDIIELESPIKRVYIRRGDEPTVLFRLAEEGFYERISNVFF